VPPAAAERLFDDHARALRGERERVLAAQPGACAGDDRDPAVKKPHRSPLSSVVAPPPDPPERRVEHRRGELASLGAA